MKKKNIISLVLFCLILGFAYFVYSKKTETDILKSNMTLYFIDTVSEGISLNPSDSDTRSNQYVLKQVIANLVIKGSGGSIAPFIASSWKVDESGLNWVFEFNSNIKTETGELISPSSYKENLERLAKLYLSKKELLLFPSLVGWEQFKTQRTSEISGIVAEKEKLIFQFRERPHGVLDVLTMPYFGYYDSTNFLDGKWKNDRNIVASGPYKVKLFDEKMIELEKYNSFFYNPKSPENVIVRYETQEEMISKNYESMIAYASNNWRVKKDTLEKINDAPTFFSTFAVNPFKSEVFKNESNRRIFRDVFLKYKKKYMKQYEGIYIADFVYFTNKIEPVKSSNSGSFKNTNEIVTLLYPIDSKEKRIEDLTKALISTLEELKIQYKVMDYWDKDDLKNIQAGNVYDIAYIGVDTGSAPKNWVVDMMWCTKMGVSFHDPNGTICQLTKDYKDKDIYGIDDEYNRRLNQAIEDDATIIPLFHRGQTFLTTKNIDFSNFGQLSGAIYFNMIEFKDAE